MATGAHQLSHVERRRGGKKTSQGHTKRDEPMSQPVSSRENGVERSKNEGWTQRCPNSNDVFLPYLFRPRRSLTRVLTFHLSMPEEQPSFKSATCPQVIWLKKHPNLFLLCFLAKNQAPPHLFCHLHRSATMGHVSGYFFVQCKDDNVAFDCFGCLSFGG